MSRRPLRFFLLSPVVRPGLQPTRPDPCRYDPGTRRTGAGGVPKPSRDAGRKADEVPQRQAGEATEFLGKEVLT